MRTIVEIPKDLLNALAEVCRHEKISRAEAIRRAVRIYLRGKISKNDTPAFGLWSKRKIDGLEYEDRIRHEWGQRSDP